MIVKHLNEIIGTRDEVSTKNWTSRRLLLKKDGLGFSLHDTIIKKGTETLIWYKHHVEAVYCIAGEGEIEMLDENGEKKGEIYPITEGTLYVLDGHEKHLLRATKNEMRMICIFNPPLTGQEVHDAEGTYPLIEG